MVRLPDGEGAIPVVLIGNKVRGGLATCGIASPVTRVSNFSLSLTSCAQCDVEMGDGQVDQSHLDRFCEEHQFLSWYVLALIHGPLKH